MAEGLNEKEFDEDVSHLVQALIKNKDKDEFLNEWNMITDETLMSLTDYLIENGGLQVDSPEGKATTY